MILRPNLKMPYVGFGPDIPEAFASLEEARNNLDYQSNRYIGFLKEVELRNYDPEDERRFADEEVETERKKYQGLLDKWETAFERFLQSPYTTLDPKGQRGALALKIYQRIGALHLKVPVSRMLTDESVWDAFVPDGEEIVSLAESLVASEDSTVTTKTPIFSFDISIVGPLYSVAHKCRDPFLRRRAIALLRSSPRQEGIWDSHLAARVAERIMTIEESGLGEVRSAMDVPDWARISDVQASFDQMETKASFSYSRQRSKLEYVRESVTETFKW